MRGVLAQEIHHRVKNNLQTVASLLRLQARADGVEPREALEHSVNRILAIAAVHEVLTEQREDDVELAELLDRLRAMLVQGAAARAGREGGRGTGGWWRAPSRRAGRGRKPPRASWSRRSGSGCRSSTSSASTSTRSCTSRSAPAPASRPGSKRSSCAASRSR